MPKRILALDIANTTGYAWTDGDRLLSGVWRFTTKTKQSPGMRFLHFQDVLAAFHKNTGFDAVYYEQVRRHLGVDAAHVYGGYESHLMAFCDRNQVEYQGIDVGAIKKHATGKGNADKAAMVAAAKARGWRVEDDNEADALWILDLVRNWK